MLEVIAEGPDRQRRCSRSHGHRSHSILKNEVGTHIDVEQGTTQT